jgi:hypothetical protein
MPITHTPSQPIAASQRASGQPVELARYASSDGPRRLVGQRIDGIVRVTDEPTGDAGVVYLVEAHLESTAALEALVADYLNKAERLGYPPMHGWF